MVLINECSWGFCSTRGRGGGVGAVLVPLFDKVARLRAYEFIVKRLRRACFPVGIARFLRMKFFLEHLVAASELSVLQKLCFL